jgi:hypothetical protein
VGKSREVLIEYQHVPYRKGIKMATDTGSHLADALSYSLSGYAKEQYENMAAKIFTREVLLHTTTFTADHEGPKQAPQTLDDAIQREVNHITGGL